MEVRRWRQLVQEAVLLMGSIEMGDAPGRGCGVKGNFSLIFS